MPRKLGFTFAGRTMDYFGSKSITSDITALFELIKNSRDANAGKVTIHFKGSGRNASIEISDNGDGMSEDDVKSKWMVIGTTSRLDDDMTKTGKPVWGEMGIGRMACQKLGSLTDMTTVKNGKRFRMSFDWSLFENVGITVGEISFPFETDRTNVKNGTILEIHNLKSEWTGSKINKLKNELGILISEESFDDVQITVKVRNDDGYIIKKDHTKLLRDVTNSAPFKLKGIFDGEVLDVSILAQVGQRGRWEKQDTTGIYNDCPTGPFTIELFHFPRAPGKAPSHDFEKYYKQRIGTDKLEDFLEENYGVYLYRDGAWMKPYGHETDWLSLEAGARQETSKIGLKQVFGRVNLSKKENPEIKPASHRETLIENKAYEELKRIMGEVFEVLRHYMNEWKKRQDAPTTKPPVLGDPDPTSHEDIITNIKKITRDLPASDRRVIGLGLDGIRNMVSGIKEEKEYAISEMGEIRSYEKNLATLGIATSFMARQVTGPLEENMKIVSEGEEMREKIRTQNWKMSDREITRSASMLEDMKHNQHQMLHFMKFVSVLAEHISQSIKNNKRYAQVDVLECWETVSDGFQDRCDELGIKVTSSIKDQRTRQSLHKLVVKIDRIDLECILTNIYLNSIYSLEKTRGRKRKVKLLCWHNDDTLFIEFADNGRGIPASKLKEVFEPFKFGHRQDGKHMHGHGLGLYIVMKIMDNYGGRAKALDVNEGAKIRLEFPNVTKVAG